MKVKLELEYCELEKLWSLVTDEQRRLIDAISDNPNSEGIKCGLETEKQKFRKLAKRLNEVLKEQARCADSDGDILRQSNRAWHNYHTTEEYWDC